ncbi:MAG TPA: adenylate/guanylate cyclase domain-containing protein [Dermatophilaceae bacterium]|nr:adenylate/guanylate cyclase domain-containing protein [Dermatophilaceae bacterium]
MRPLPVGTLTLLFSDIEGSTSMLTGLGPRWGEALSAHRAILRRAFASHGGYEVGTEGDGFFVVFTSATEALLAAVAAQRGLAEHDWPDGRPLRVRIGLHTGEPQVHDDDYIGIDVHRGARIAASAHGGQTVMSEATHALVGEALRGMAVRDLGWHRLKDVPEPEHLYDVTPPGLAAEHSALRSLGTAASLPSYTSELIGRSKELRDVTTAIESQGARLVTLTGSGGTGKTRLAVAVARELQSRLPGDVFFVPLHTANESSRMWAAIAEAVDAPVKGEQLPRDGTLEFLRPQSALLVLDNVEQIPDADVVVAALLDGAPDVSLLVTSRRPLHLVEEHQYPLSTLAVPLRLGQLAEVVQTPAVRLFEQRTRMVRPDFAVNRENVGDVVALCRLLDGLPLAIELAAARSRMLGPRALLARIDTWFGEALTTSDRPERQRTLTATIAWSYDLLSGEDQRVFRGLGVFSSRVGIDAVENVVVSGGGDPLNVLAHLVDVSLLEITEGPDGEPMVYLLETVRRFARERLAAAREIEETRLRHAEWCVRVAGGVPNLPHGPRQISALDRMEAVIEDVRAALDWTLGATGPLAEERFSVGLTLMHSMDGYWYRFGHLEEGRVWHERALRILDSEQRDDSPAIVDALHGHGVVTVQQNDLITGGQVLERALAMAHRLGDLDREARESNSLGIARREGGDVEGARRLIERSLELARRAGSPQREATALCNMVYIHLDAGDYTTATNAARTAMVADEALGDPWGVAIDQNILATALLHAEGPQPAYRHLVDIAPSAIALGSVDLSLDVVDNFAAVWAALGDGERAATMLGAADAQRELAGIPRSAPSQAILDRFVGPARRTLDTERWDRAYARGRTISIESAVTEGSISDRAAPSESDLTRGSEGSSQRAVGSERAQ